MDVVDPSTGTRIETYEEHTESDVTEALNRSTEAFDSWRDRSIRDREQLLAAAGDVLRDNKQEYAETMTREMGKPITQAIGEVEKCAWVCDHYAE
jgi:succinate-semialdehyde dehydrogenase/glutarate-semialdehyde dehydrogenase